jgi:hypothetical protein
MPERRSLNRPTRLNRSATAFAGALFCCLVLLAGCKTSQDAASAATQMSATAKSLSDYYAALGVILSDTDQIYSINDKLYSKPYSDESRKALKTTQAELAKRVELAADLSTLAGDFAKLTGSKAPTDVAAACSKLQTEADGLASYNPSAVEQNMIKSALQLLVTAIQEHKEREAARAMDSLAGGLSSLFDKEAPAWNSVDNVYASLAANLARSLVDQYAVDNTSLLKPALEPFGLTPAPASADINSKLAPLAKQQIADRQAALESSYTRATDAMSKSLKEMSQRIHMVAEDKPMAYRAPPVTVSTVEKWAMQFLSN